MAEKLEFELTVKGGSQNGLSSGLNDAKNKASELGDILKSALGFFTGNLLTKGFDSIVRAASEATSEAVNFKRAQLEIETILPKNAKLTSQLVSELEDLSEQYGTTATAQAKAYYEIVSAGVNDAADASALLARANQLATGGITDTAKTIDLLTTIYNVYGKEVATAEEASDSLFKTVQLGKTTISELSSSLGQALPIAKSFGIGLDEVGSILAQLTNSGINTSESVTLLNAVLTAIARNGEKLGSGFNSTAVQTDGLGVVLERLKERTGGSSDALLELLGRQEAVRAVQALTAKGLQGYNQSLGEFANKAGVAAEASKKILDGDVGKQFDILGSKILSFSRSVVDIFIPITLSATKAINELFSPSEGSVQNQLRDLRNGVSQVEKMFKTGKISSEQYTEEISRLGREIEVLANKADTASNPLITLASTLERDAARINSQISDLKTGVSGLFLSPLERDLKVEELNSRLQGTIAKLAELKKVSAQPIPIVTTPRNEQAIADEEKLQSDIRALRSQFAIEEQKQKEITFAENSATELERGQLRLEAELNAKAADLQATTLAEIEKTKIIKDELLKRATEEKIAADFSLKLMKLIGDKEVAEKKLINTEKKKSDSEYKADLAATLGDISALQTSGNKTLVAVGKSAALAQLYISGSVAFGKALELGPFIGPPLAAAVAASFAAQAAKVIGVQFENGGIVGSVSGATMGADNRTATIRDGEMVLNGEDQRTLFSAIKSGSFGGGNIQIMIDGREIAYAVRNQVQGGFRLA